MAKGLFAIYRDDASLAAPPNPLDRSSVLPPNKASVRRKDGPGRLDGGLRVPRFGEKENFDPLSGSRTSGKAPLLGKPGKKPALGTKGLDDQALCGPLGLKAPRMATKRAPSAGNVDRSGNGVCTGTLRTRVLPDLPPLESEDVVPIAHSPGPRSPEASTVVEVAQNGPGEDLSPKKLCDTSVLSASTGSSAHDSGYARSLRSTQSDPDIDLDNVTTSEDVDEAYLGNIEAMDGREANRRARALTESPLAEITQAFTGLGRFSAANMASPTPSNLRSQSRPAPPHRTRSSPSSKTSSITTIPTRMVPYAYSTTATTKRVKPGQTPGEKPRTGPLRL